MKKVFLIVGGVILIALAALFFGVTNGLSEGAKVPLDGIDLTGVADGAYTGAYDFKRWSNTLVVHVEGHAITGIDVEKNVPGAEITDCFDEVRRRVIEAQDTRVDTVSGATVTSKAYLKAIENAINR